MKGKKASSVGKRSLKRFLFWASSESHVGQTSMSTDSVCSGNVGLERNWVGALAYTHTRTYMHTHTHTPREDTLRCIIRGLLAVRLSAKLTG